MVHPLLRTIQYWLLGPSFDKWARNCWDTATIGRGGEWSFKKSGSRKILAEFQGSRSLVFLADLRSRSRNFFRNVQKSQISRSRNLKREKLSVSQRKTLVSTSRKVSILPFATPSMSSDNLFAKFGILPNDFCLIVLISVHVHLDCKSWVTGVSSIVWIRYVIFISNFMWI